MLFTKVNSNAKPSFKHTQKNGHSGRGHRCLQNEDRRPKVRETKIQKRRLLKGAEMHYSAQKQ